MRHGAQGEEQMSKSEQVLELEYQIDQQYAEILRLQKRIKNQEEEISRLRHAREILHRADLLVRGRVLEEAAKVAKGDEASATEYYRGRVHAAAAVLALKEKP